MSARILLAALFLGLNLAVLIARDWVLSVVWATLGMPIIVPMGLLLLAGVPFEAALGVGILCALSFYLYVAVRLVKRWVAPPPRALTIRELHLRAKVEWER